MSFLPLFVAWIWQFEIGPILIKFLEILNRKCWRQQKNCWQSMTFRYLKKLDLKGMLRVKFQISHTFGSTFNLGVASIPPA